MLILAGRLSKPDLSFDCLYYFFKDLGLRIISTRLFFLFPSVVELDSCGRYSPYPIAAMREGLIFFLCNRNSATEAARAIDNSRFDLYIQLLLRGTLSVDRKSVV